MPDDPDDRHVVDEDVSQPSSSPLTASPELNVAIRNRDSILDLLGSGTVDWDEIAKQAHSGLAALKQCRPDELAAQPVQYEIFFSGILLRCAYSWLVFNGNRHATPKELKNPLRRRGTWCRFRPWKHVLQQTDNDLLRHLDTAATPEILRHLRRIGAELEQVFEQKNS